jgi:hypothetical protein
LRKPFWKYAFIPILVNAAVLGAFISRDPGWWGLRGAYDRLACVFGPRMPAVQGLHQGFPEGKAQAQALAQMLAQADPAAVRLDPSDTPGWSVYTVPEGATSQTLVFEVQAAGEELLYFPRASGPDSSVEVAVLDGAKPRPLARLAGKPDVWTPIGARWAIPLACFDQGKPLRLQVTLTGPWAQLWVRDKAVFF